MKFTTEDQAQFLTQVREHPDAHREFPREAYRREDGRILVYIDGLAIFLHRWAYEQIIGPIPRRFLLPSCESKWCQNPHHWAPSGSSIVPRAAPRVQSVGGMSAPEINAAKTHCPERHEYTPANTYLWADKTGHVHRKCKRCTIRRTAEQRRQERASAEGK